MYSNSFFLNHDLGIINNYHCALYIRLIHTLQPYLENLGKEDYTVVNSDEFYEGQEAIEGLIDMLDNWADASHGVIVDHEKKLR